MCKQWKQVLRHKAPPFTLGIDFVVHATITRLESLLLQLFSRLLVRELEPLLLGVREERGAHV